MLGVILIGAIFLLLLGTAVYILVTQGEWLLLAPVALLGFASFGLWRSYRERARRPAAPGGPVLVVDDFGIGDAHRRIPWADITEVDPALSRLQTALADEGRAMANALTDRLGVLDGDFVVVVHVRGGRQVRFDVGTHVPGNHWEGIRDAVAAHARARDIPTRWG